jgi:UDP-N-acetylmuramate--alanine ligase
MSLQVGAYGARRVIALESPEALAPLVSGIAQSGDLVACLGAGSITQWAYALPGELAAAGL